MEFAIVKDKVVVSRIVANPDSAAKIAEEMGATVVDDPGAQVGYKKQGNKWVPDALPKAVQTPILTLEALSNLLVSKGVVTEQELEQAKT